VRPRSLRVRLALWHAGLLALTLVTLSILTLLLLRTLLNSRADQALYDYADKTARNIATTLYQSSLPGRERPSRFLNKDLQEWGRQIQVVDAHTGGVLDRSDGLASHPLPRDLDVRVNGLKGVTTYQTFYSLGEHPVRVVTVPVEMGKEIPYLVQAAASLEGIEDALRRTSIILLVLTPSVLVLALLGGWVLVGRSLQPVDAMTRTAMSMQPGKMDHRIEPTGSDDEIARLASAFNEMIARLDRSFRQVQQFSADASHELKTPLTSIRGEAEVALMGDLTPEEHRRVLRSIVDEVERMSAIVENLLLLARADAEQVHIRRERLHLEGIVLEAYEQLEGLARRKQITLDIATMDEAEVEGDPLWLGQILTNLLNNAIKYTPEGGTVTLSLEVIDQEGRVAVTDTGPGIPAEHLPHIFDRFYRVDSGRSRDAGGVGLGLNIAQWAAQTQGGRIEVESEVGKGTTFTLCLPVSGAPASVTSESSRAKEPANS
jgi:heavy metal sensor kinase